MLTAVNTRNSMNNVQIVLITLFISLVIYLIYMQCDTKAKQPKSGDLYGNITEYGVAEEHLSPQREGDLPPP